MSLKEVVVRLREKEYFGALGYLMAREVDGIVGKISTKLPAGASDGSIGFYVHTEFEPVVLGVLQEEFGALAS